MFKTIFLAILLIIAAAWAAETFWKEEPFVKNTKEVIQAQIQKIEDGPIGKQWDKVIAYVQRLDKKANRKKSQDAAMGTQSKPTPPVVAPAKKNAKQTEASTSPKTGIIKSESKKRWKDDKGVYDWKDGKKVYK